LFLSFRYSVERFIPNCFATVWIDRSRSTILAFSLLTLTTKPDLPCRTSCDRTPSFYTSEFVGSSHFFRMARHKIGYLAIDVLQLCACRCTLDRGVMGMETIGERIKRLRQERDLSPED